jgi:hypothetical protein
MNSDALVRADKPSKMTPLIGGSARKAGGLLPKHPDQHPAMLIVGSFISVSVGMLLNAFHLARLVPFALVTLVLAAGTLLQLRWSAVRRWKVARAFARLPRPRHLRDAQPGRWLRVEGVAHPCRGTISTVSGHDAVAVRYVGARAQQDGRQRDHARWELHAVDFEVALPDGERVLVSADHLVLLPHPPRFPAKHLPARPLPNDGSKPDEAWIYSEEALVPGQAVVAAGILELVVDPTAAVASDRQSRLRSVLRGDPHRPVYLRPGAGSAAPLATAREVVPL